MSKLIQTAPCKRIFEKGSHTRTADVTNCLIYISFWMEEWRQNPILTILYSAWEMCWCVSVYSINSSGHHVPAVTQHFRFRLKFDCFNHLNYRSTFNSSDSSNCCVCYDQQSKGYYKSSTIIHSLMIWKLRINTCLYNNNK